MESESKPKRVYVKKAKLVETTDEIIEPKPKRTYTKKTKIIEETPSIVPDVVQTIVEETPTIIEEKKPKRVYIKKSKVVEENNNNESINTQIDIIQKDLDNLKIEDDEVIESDNIEENILLTEVIQNDNIQIKNEDNKRKIDDNLEQEVKKPSLYTYEIDIDLNLYIYDKFYDGSRLNKKSVLQISSFISTHIVDLEQYIIKKFYIKSNNSDIKVCYLSNNFNNNGKYDFNTKIYIDNKTHKNVYEELISSYNKNKKDFIYFKKYIIEVFFYEIYSEIYSINIDI
jgi:hypothetical protein